VKLFRTVLGIDLSGARIAIVAFRTAPGGPSVVLPPLAHEFRGEREAARLEEAESVLGEFVARHGLVGAKAFLSIPAERVHMARAAFPPLREKDLQEAVGLELDRLFPVPSETLRHRYRTAPEIPEGGKISLVVAAVSREYLDLCGQIVSRTGMTLAAAVPAGWAAAAAVSRVSGKGSRHAGAISVVLRWLGDSVECTVLAGREPLFCASRPCAQESAQAEGISIALAGLADALPGTEEPVDLYAPSGWFPESAFHSGADAVPFRVREDFPAAASTALSGPGLPAAGEDPFPFLCAFGAVAAGREMDLLSTRRSGEMSRAARTAVGIAAAAALSLGVAWPATVAWRSKADLLRLEARVAALRPFAEQHEESLADLDEAQAKISVLRGEASAAGEPVRILKELTDRIPDGTWLLSLRVEGRKVDLEGLSPSASEIFPALTRDGRFRSVDFGAPITRQADNMERFKIRGEFVPPPPEPAVPPAPPGPGKKP
jgi:Tfp pilus assembly protein PilN